MNRAVVFYVLLLTLASFSVLGVLHLGTSLPTPHTLTEKTAKLEAISTKPDSTGDAILSNLSKNFGSPLGHLFLQLVLIIAAARLMGLLFSKLGQPSVVGEMTMGILLGPSLFGLLAPEFFQFVFPANTLGTLKLLSQIGVCLFMFAVGMELNLALVRKKAPTAVLVSHASVMIPFLLGSILAYFLYTDLAASGATFTAFALFMGTSMSITAFPVLARILRDRGLSHTLLGSTAITCAAVDDVTAWTILAIVVAIVQATSIAGASLNLVLVLIFVAGMLWIIKPLLPHIFGRSLQEQNPSSGALAAITCFVIGSALCTEAIGIHALFGAFLAGTIIPDTNHFRQKLAVRIETFSSVLLLPLFFVFTGLRTQVGLLSDLSDWLLCLLIIAVATAGKLGGSAVAARLSGMTWRDSLQLGALMNTRGLMELIALNIAYDMGILSLKIFSMLVIMALITTMMTGPLLRLFGKAEDHPLSERS